MGECERGAREYREEIGRSGGGGDGAVRVSDGRVFRAVVLDQRPDRRGFLDVSSAFCGGKVDLGLTLFVEVEWHLAIIR